jgi:signal transduction histidine kinase
MPEWALQFGAARPLPATDWKRVLNYARVAFPIVVLACGVLMTARIVRRELALASMQAAFVASVTHEFKSPITSIRLLMERIAGGRLAAGDSPQRYFEAIAAETGRLEGLVNRLFEAQKVQTGQREYAFHPAAIEPLVQDAVKRMRPQAEARHIDLVVQSAPGIPQLALDTESVSDAVRNLLDNAIKYSPDRAHVDVTLGVNDGRIELTVADEGIGVDPAEANRIFEPFYRSRRGDRANVHGTGLGLSLVKATVEAHGGTVRVRSDGARGSRFTLAFPVRSDDVREAHP